MGRFWVRAAAIIISLAVFTLLMLRAKDREPPRVVPLQPVDAAAPQLAVQSPAPAAQKLYPLRGPATKSDPHLAKMLSEEAAMRAGKLGILKEPSPAP